MIMLERRAHTQKVWFSEQKKEQSFRAYLFSLNHLFVCVCVCWARSWLVTQPASSFLFFLLANRIRVVYPSLFLLRKQQGKVGSSQKSARKTQDASVEVFLSLLFFLLLLLKQHNYSGRKLFEQLKRVCLTWLANTWITHCVCDSTLADCCWA